MAEHGGDLLLDLFSSHDIDHIFCSPGTEWAPVWESLLKRYDSGDRSIEYINCRHEILAVAAALGYAKSSRKPSAGLLHANVGPLHGAMAMRAALLTRAPIVICSAYSSDFGDYEGNMSHESHWISRLSDIGGPTTLVKPYVKWTNTVTSKQTLIDSINRGAQIAQADPCGPVFLAIPKELMAEDLGSANLPSSVNVSVKTQPACDDLTEMASLLVESKNPLIITEYAGENPGSVNRLVELAELLSIPVTETSSPVFTSFPKKHPLFQGNGDTEILARADVVLVVGSTTPWFPPSAYPKNNAKVIVLDEDPLKVRLPYDGYRSNFHVVGDIEQSLIQLIGAVGNCLENNAKPNSLYQQRLERYTTRHNQMAKQALAEAKADKSLKPISPKWFHYVANQILPGNAISIVETLTHSRHFYRYMTESQTLFRCSGGGLGSGMGIAIGAKIASPDTPVIFYVGDGSFNYNPVLAGLGLCQEYKLPILTVIFNNGRYAAMGIGHRSLFPDGWAATHDSYLGVDITPQPDYVKIAEAFDTYAEKIEDPAGIEPALKRALKKLADGKSVLLDVITS